MWDRALAVPDEARWELTNARDNRFLPSPTGLNQDALYLPRLMLALKIRAVPDGFRSGFRDRATECTDTPRDFCAFVLTPLAIASANTEYPSLQGCNVPFKIA